MALNNLKRLPLTVTRIWMGLCVCRRLAVNSRLQCGCGRCWRMRLDLIGRALWSAGLIAATGSKKKNLEDWLWDDYFKQHCKVFGNRPFVWHVWDGRKDGFSALVHYHRLDRSLLEKLTFATLGWWIERQRADAGRGEPGAAERLGAANDLQGRLKLILEGEAPYDVFVRWKELWGTANRLGSRPRRRSQTQYPPLHPGQRPPLEGRGALAQGSGQEH